MKSAIGKLSAGKAKKPRLGKFPYSPDYGVHGEAGGASEREAGLLGGR